jgi:hypothetical protein
MLDNCFFMVCNNDNTKKGGVMRTNIYVHLMGIYLIVLPHKYSVDRHINIFWKKYINNC